MTSGRKGTPPRRLRGSLLRYKANLNICQAFQSDRPGSADPIRGPKLKLLAYFPHGIAGAGAVVGAIVQDGALALIPPSQDCVAIFLKPIAAVRTTRTNTTNISHLLIDPSG